jgi:hypothetical protein
MSPSFIDKSLWEKACEANDRQLKGTASPPETNLSLPQRHHVTDLKSFGIKIPQYVFMPVVVGKTRDSGCNALYLRARPKIIDDEEMGEWITQSF